MTENDFKAGEDKGLILGELKLIRQEISGMKDSFLEFRAGIGSRIEKIEDGESVCKLNLTTEITQLQTEQKSLFEKIEDVADSKQWVIRIIVGAFILALLGLVWKK